MAEYIEREKAIELIERYGGDIAVREIKRLPAADVRPERRGHWIICSDGYYPYCSECTKEPPGKEMTDYCPNCGAKMKRTVSRMADWIEVEAQKPPENKVVKTKIDDEKGIRNETELIYSHGLWWFPDWSMYVYYTPTHWRVLNDVEDGDGNG